MADRLALPTSDHGVAGSNPAEGEILPEPKQRFIAQSPSCSPFHRLEMTEILLKGRKTLTHPSIIKTSFGEKSIQIGKLSIPLPTFNSAYVQHILIKVVPNESLDIAHYLSIHISKLPLLHIHEVLFNLFVFVKSQKPSKLELNFVYISIFTYHFG